MTHSINALSGYPLPRRSAAAVLAWASVVWLSWPIVVVAQTPTISQRELQCADCSLTGQKPEATRFDPAQITLVTNPQPFVFRNRGMQLAIIARVLRASPLILEVLDGKVQAVDGRSRVVEDDFREKNDRGQCGVSSFTHVDSRSNPIVSTLAFNDLVTARLVIAVPDFIVADVRKVSGSVRLFHTRSELDTCADPSGRLVEYHGLDDEELIVYNDGGIEYRALGARNVNRDTLSATDRSALLQAFAGASFDRLPDMLPASTRGDRLTLTLAGTRFQHVSISGRESALAPLLRRLESVGAKAAAHGRFRLQPGKPVAVTIIPWPYPQVDLNRFYDLTETAAQQGLYGVVKVPGNFDVLHQRLPADFLGRVPLIEGTTGSEVDPNRYVYFSQSERLYRVAREPDCGRPGTDCTLERLRVEEIVAGGTSLEIPGASLTLGNRLSLDSPRVFQVLPGQAVPVKVLRQRPIAWLWPQDAGLKLGDVPPEGKVISGDEFGKHKALYASILKVWTYGGRRLNFIDGGFQYEEVHLCQVKPGSAADECEVIP